MDKHLLRYKGSKTVMAVVGLLTVAQAIAIITQAIYLAKAITQMFHREPFSVYSESFVLFFVAYAFRQLLQWAKERIAYRFAIRVSEYERERLIQKTFEIGPDIIGTHGSGNIITLALEGIPKYRKYVELFIPRFLSMAIIPIMIVMFILTQDILSGVTLIIVMPVLIIFLILIGLVSQKKVDEQMESYRLLSRHFVDSLRGLVTLKFLGRSRAHEGAIATVSNKYRIATNRALKYAFMSSFALDFFSSLSVALIAVELGMKLINGTMLLQPALLVLILAPDYFLPVRELGNDFHATTDGQDAGDEIRKVLAMTVHEKSTEPMRIEEGTTFTFRGVSKYGDEGEPILKRLHFTVGHQDKVGIVGLSGSGKSTLIRLLAGFTTFEEGAVEMNGQTFSTLNNAEWHKRLAYIPQHPTIFSASVIDNLRFYEPEASFEQVVRATKTVGLYELIQSFPHQFEEKIGQGGRALSGGEEQRIALARTLLRRSDVMLFDEPTAHLDIETEHDIKEIIVPLLEQHLVFFATHRMHWMKQMDHILVLDQGELVQFGTYDQLAKSEGKFREMLVASQKGGAV